jgi:SAM-dependent methyltransferase
MTRLIMLEKLSQSERLSFEEASGDPVFREIVAWIGTFLCAPHAELGRAGDVCPFAKTALTKRAVEFFRTACTDAKSLEEDMRQHLLEFEQGDRTDIYRCRLIVPTRMDDPASAVQSVQRALKPWFVERHLMIGQFYQDCDEPGLWNKDFRPLRTPVPLLAIRNMVPTDVAFLYHDASYLRSYLDKFGSRGSSALRQFEMTREANK